MIDRLIKFLKTITSTLQKIKQRFMNRLLLLFFLLSLSFVASAQSNKIEIVNDSVYLGRIPLEDAIQYDFEFKVKRGGQAQIKEIKTDCACSVVDYPKSVLRSGQMGKVKVEFDPYKPGPFEKRFLVSWEGSAAEDELILKGYIEPNTVPIDLDFPVEWGRFRLKSKTIAFGNIPNQSVVRRRVQVHNPTSFTFNFEDSVVLPKYLEVVWGEQSLLPNSTINFDIYFDPSIKNDFGYSLDNLLFFTNDPNHPQLSLDISSNIYLDTRNRPKVEMPKAPEIWVSDDTLSLGKVFSSNSFVVTFVVYNRGKEKLQIHEIVPDQDCVIMEVGKKELLENEYTNIKVRVSDLFKNAGTQYRTIKIINNDPKAREKLLTITADVIK